MSYIKSAYSEMGVSGKATQPKRRQPAASLAITHKEMKRSTFKSGHKWTTSGDDSFCSCCRQPKFVVEFLKCSGSM